MSTKLDASKALRFASATLREPPRHAHIERTEPVGKFVVRFVLPLDWCPPLNRFSEMPGWKRKQLKDNVLWHMTARQGMRRQASPLPGRPLVRAIRFSSADNDEHNGWTKIGVDRLTGNHGGLNYLVDDRPKCLRLKQWWEPAPRGEGFCYFELWSGGDA